MGTKTSSNTVVARCTQRKAAANEYVPGKGTILVQAQAYTQQQVEAVYQTCLDSRATLVNLRGQVAAALIARNQADGAMNSFDAGMRAWVDVTFGPNSQQAVDFGYTKKPPVKPLVEVKAKAQVKAKATRQARGIVGPKKRKQIFAAPAATPAAPEAPTAPAAPTTTTPKA